MTDSPPGLSGLFSASRGRPVAAVILILFAILLWFPEQSPFQSMRLFLFDRYQSWLPRERVSAPVTIVGIDEASLKQMGQWPWPRTKMAELLERINGNRPAAIGVDIIMPEADRYSPVNLAKSLRQIGPTLQQRLMTLPDNDRILADMLAQAPVVLGAAGFESPTSTTMPTMRTAPVVQQGGEAARFVKHYPAVLKSLPLLEDAASGQALLNGNLEKGIVRRIPLVSRVGAALAPTLSLEMLRVALNLPAIQVNIGSQGIASVRLGDIRIPTQPDGEVWVHF
jgi:CheY-like chemotaxis protein